MEKSKLNLVIDALLLLCLAAIAGIGLLIKYVLVPGYQRWEIYGRNVSLFLLGGEMSACFFGDWIGINGELFIL